MQVWFCMIKNPEIDFVLRCPQGFTISVASDVNSEFITKGFLRGKANDKCVQLMTCK